MGSTPHFGLGNRTLSLSTCSLPIKQVGMFSFAMSLFAFVIIHQGHERKEINLCLAAFIGHRLRIEITFRRENFTTILCTSQLKPPPLGSRGRVGDLTLTPVKRHQYPYPLRLEFRSNAPTPEARKMKILKLSRKKEMCLNGEIFQVYMYKYAVLIKLLVQ